MMKAKRTFLARIQRRIRVSRLNMRSGIQIHHSTYIARSATIQIDADGCVLGGRLWSRNASLFPTAASSRSGAHAYIGPYCVLYGHGDLAIGRNTMIGAHTTIIPANHGWTRLDRPMNVQPLTMKGITIGEDVWTGAGCKILDGVQIENGAVAGAGSVVTKNIDAYLIALGVPAKVVGSRQRPSAGVRTNGGVAATSAAS